MNLKRAIVYVSEAEKEKKRTIEETVSSVLATYPNSLLVELDADQINSLESQGLNLEIQEGSRMIRLRAVEFDTSEKAPSPPQILTLSAAEMEEKRNYWIVQFVGPVKSEWREKIEELGGKLQNYIPENAFLVEMTSETKKKAEELPFVEWVGVYQPVYKVSPLLMGRKKRAAPSELSTLSISTEAFKPGPGGNVNVMVHDPADLKRVSEVIEELGGTVVTAGKDTIRASLDLSQIDKVARMVEVKWIEPYVLPELFNDVAAEIMAVPPVWETCELDGEGEIVAVADTGLDTGKNDNTMHEDFKGRIDSIHSWPISKGYDNYVNNPGADDGAADKDLGHGTHVAGSVLGNGAQSDDDIRGMAYEAQLVFQAIEQWIDWKNPAWTDEYGLAGIPDDLNELFQQAYDDGARIHTNSWGSIKDSQGNLAEGQYLISSRQIDEFMWKNKDMVILFAVGNSGRDGDSNGVIDEDSLSIQACAKNCISVGASENNRPPGSKPAPGYDIPWGTGSWLTKFPENPIKDDHVSDNPEGMAAFSSRGPTDDGRIKPDVVAPGTNILSVRSSKATGHGWGLLPTSDSRRPYYMYMGGTSMATPLTAGVVALIRQYLRKVRDHNEPSAALVKAILIHGAISMEGQYNPSEVGPVPDVNQGWGRVNLRNSVSPDLPVIMEFKDDPADALGTGEYKEFAFKVANDTEPFKATLVWTDYPSDPSTGGLVNKLRVSVIPPSGPTEYGVPENNNVQQVTIENPLLGVHTVRIWAKEVNEGGKQDFALVVSGGMTPPVDVYIRDNVDDTGDRHTGSISNSPDIILRNEEVPNPQGEFGEGSGNEDRLDLSDEAIAGHENYIYVRIRNRGELPAKNVKATVYWSEVGTLITPDQWNLVGSIPILEVPEGDDLTVSDPIPWSDTPGKGHYCFVGLIGNCKDPAPDINLEDLSIWDNYCSFIRRYNNVTWKNFNVVEPPPPEEGTGYMELPFLTPGALDKTRQMQLEIVANLPRRALLWYEVRPNIIDGRHFRERGVDRKRDRARLEIKPHGTTKFIVRFPAQSKAKSKLVAYIPEEERNNEYKIFARQLYRRKEVGRVTWLITPRRRTR